MRGGVLHSEVWPLAEDVLLLIGTSLAFFGSFLLTDWFRSLRVTVAFSFVPLLATTAMLSAFVENPFLHAVCWLVAGFACGMLLMLGSAFLCSLSHKRLLVLLSVGTAVGIVLALTAIMLSAEGRCVAVGVLGVVASSLLMYANLLCRKSLPFVTRDESKQHSKVSKTSFAATVGNSLCIGFMLYTCSFVCSNPYRFALVGAIGLVSAAIMLVDSMFNEYINEHLELKLTMPGVVLGFGFLVFVDGDGVLLGCMVLSAVFTIQYITNLAAVCENVYLYKLSPTRSLGLWRQGNMLGMALGMLAAYLAYDFCDIDNSVLTGGVIFSILFLLALFSSFLYQDAYPSIEPPTAREKLASGEIEGNKGRWIARCEAYAAYTGLSPREQEVAILLATGHDPEFIQNKLYISKNTVKAHTYNIYRKANVHSRKELIAAIENLAHKDDAAKRQTL